MPFRVALLTALALAAGLWVAGPSGSAAAEPTADPASTPAASPTTEPKAQASPTCAVGLVCLPSSPSPTPEPTLTNEPSPTRTASPTPKATRTSRPSRSPRPDPTFTERLGPTDNPVTATVGVGGIPAERSSPEPKKTSAGASEKIDKILGLVLLSALALGFAGATGLYVTRHRPLH